MSRKRKPTCFLCREKPAKLLVAKNRNGAEYVCGAVDPVFCSLRCAANYALIRANEQEYHWCEAKNDWVCCYASECRDCEPKGDE